MRPAPHGRAGPARHAGRRQPGCEGGRAREGRPEGGLPGRHRAVRHGRAALCARGLHLAGARARRGRAVPRAPRRPHAWGRPAARRHALLHARKGTFRRQSGQKPCATCSSESKVWVPTPSLPSWTPCRGRHLPTCGAAPSEWHVVRELTRPSASAGARRALTRPRARAGRRATSTWTSSAWSRTGTGATSSGTRCASRC